MEASAMGNMQDRVDKRDTVPLPLQTQAKTSTNATTPCEAERWTQKDTYQV